MHFLRVSSVLELHLFDDRLHADTDGEPLGKQINIKSPRPVYSLRLRESALCCVLTGRQHMQRCTPKEAWYYGR